MKNYIKPSKDIKYHIQAGVFKPFLDWLKSSDVQLLDLSRVFRHKILNYTERLVFFKFLVESGVPIKGLKLCQNKFCDDLPDIINVLSGLKSLEILDLSHNMIWSQWIKVAPQLSYCTSLTSLILRDTHLVEMGPKVARILSSLPKLRTINLSGNWLGAYLIEMAKEFSGYSNLENINLSNNQSEISTEIIFKHLQGCSRLISINFSNNFQKSNINCLNVLDSIRHMDTLRTLILDNNKSFSYYQDGQIIDKLSELNNLQKLSLKGCEISLESEKKIKQFYSQSDSTLITLRLSQVGLGKTQRLKNLVNRWYSVNTLNDLEAPASKVQSLKLMALKNLICQFDSNQLKTLLPHLPNELKAPVIVKIDDIPISKALECGPDVVVDTFKLKNTPASPS